VILAIWKETPPVPAQSDYPRKIAKGRPIGRPWVFEVTTSCQAQCKAVVDGAPKLSFCPLDREVCKEVEQRRLPVQTV
jgi:hypothetical protein